MTPHQAAARPNATAARGAQDGATGILDIDTMEPNAANMIVANAQGAFASSGVEEDGKNGQ